MTDPVEPEIQNFDLIVSAVRLPLAYCAIVVMTIVHVIYFILESVTALIWLPIAAAVYDRGNLRNSWLSTYPNVIRNGAGGHFRLTGGHSSYHQSLFSHLFETAIGLTIATVRPPTGYIPMVRAALAWVTR